MTPDTEVNEPSTVYEINVSQNRFNQNNIDKWKTYIAQNGNNNNVIGFNVVRIEEDRIDSKATKHTREQVLNKGTTVTGSYSDSDLNSQRQKVVEHLRHIYMEPNNKGLYFYGARRADAKPNWGVEASCAGKEYDIKSHRIKITGSHTVDATDNKLAWMCYEGISNFERTPNVPDAVPDMVTALFGATNNYDNGGDFLYHLKQLYIANSSDISSETDFNNKLVKLMQYLMSNGEHTADNLREFCWDTSLYNNAGVTASDRAKWSRIGYLTTVIQFAWLAQAVGDTETYP